MSETSPEAAVSLLEAALRREQKKRALVQDVGRALSGGLDLDQLLVVIMEKITQLMDADYFEAAWRLKHSAVRGRAGVTMERVASEAGVSAKYLQVVWSILEGAPDDAGLDVRRGV